MTTDDVRRRQLTTDVTKEAGLTVSDQTDPTQNDGAVLDPFEQSLRGDATPDVAAEPAATDEQVADTAVEPTEDASELMRLQTHAERSRAARMRWNAGQDRVKRAAPIAPTMRRG